VTVDSANTSVAMAAGFFPPLGPLESRVAPGLRVVGMDYASTAVASTVATVVGSVPRRGPLPLPGPL